MGRLLAERAYRASMTVAPHTDQRMLAHFIRACAPFLAAASTGPEPFGARALAQQRSMGIGLAVRIAPWPLFRRRQHQRQQVLDERPAGLQHKPFAVSKIGREIGLQPDADGLDELAGQRDDLRVE